MEFPTPARLTRAVTRRIIDYGIDGFGPLDSAAELGEAYKTDGHGTPRQRARRMIVVEARRGFVGGFATGLGGVLALPVTVPSALLINWIIQARMNAAIAYLFGHDINHPHVRERILATVLDSDTLADADDDSEQASEGLGWHTLKQLPGSAFTTLAGFAKKTLIKRGLQSGVKLAAPRMLPIVGGVLSGRVDANACRRAGERALRMFASGPPPGQTQQLPISTVVTSAKVRGATVH